MIQIKPFRIEDLEALDSPHLHAIGSLEAIRKCAVPEHARTGLHVKRPIACGGVIPVWAGVGQGWVVIDQDAPGLLVVRAMAKALRQIAEAGPFHRIHADVRSEFTLGRRLLHVLGFKWEGRAEAFTSDGEDFERYAWVDRGLL